MFTITKFIITTKTQECNISWNETRHVPDVSSDVVHFLLFFCETHFNHHKLNRHLHTRLFHSVHGTGRAYFNHVCVPITDISGRVHLRLAERHDVFLPRTKTQLGRRSFHVAAEADRNSTLLRSAASISHGQCTYGSKTHLCTQSYTDTFQNMF